MPARKKKAKITTWHGGFRMLANIKLTGPSERRRNSIRNISGIRPNYAANEIYYDSEADAVIGKAECGDDCLISIGPKEHAKVAEFFTACATRTPPGTCPD